MRISTSMINSNHISGMLKKQTELHYTSQQLGTGKRVLTPSDDPVASTLAYNAKNKLANIEQYGKNINYAEKSLRTGESTLETIHNRLSRVRQLMIQANNDTLGNDGRVTIGLEMREITKQLETLVNTKDEQGNYIFSGSKVDTAPFARQNDGSYSYQGDAKQRGVQISESVSVALNVTGKEVFADIPSAAYALDKVKSYPGTANTGTGDITVASGTQAFLDGNQIGDYQIDVVAAAAPPADARVSITAPTGEVLFSNADTGASLDIDTVMATAMTLLATHLNSGTDGSSGDLAFNPVVGAAQGDSFTLRVNNEKQDMMTGMQRLTESLENFTNLDQERDMLEASLNDIDSWLNSVEVARTEIGTRRNSIDAVSSNNASVEIFLKEEVSNLEDLDYASAIGEFTLQQTALQASQQTFSKISQLSLFNFIR